MGEILNTIGQVQRNWTTYEKWEEDQDKLELARKEYRKQHPLSAQEKKEAEKRGQTILNAINIMDEYSEDKAEDMENATEAAISLPMQITASIGAVIGAALGSKKKKSFSSFPILVGSTVGALAGYIPLSILATKAQVGASRVARFQAMEKELKDPKKFVILNDAQLQQAQKEVPNIPDEEEKEKKESKTKKFFPLFESISTIKSLSKDRKPYENWRKQYEAKNKQIKSSYKQGIPVDKEQKARKDQHILVNTVKKINITAEEYSENVETAAGSIGPFAGLASSAVFGGITNYTLKKFNLPENHFLVKNKKFAVVIAALAPMIALGTYFTSIQKDAARIGRYKAKQEILSDPDKLVYKEDDEKKIKELAKDIDAPKKKKGFVNEVTQSTKLLINAHKDKKEWENYKKTTVKEEAKLRKAVEKVDVTEEQFVEGKNLQEKTFNTFEKIDENSQRYSESAEAVTDIAQQVIPSLLYLGVMGSGALLGMYARKKYKNIKPEDLTKIADNIANNRFIKPIANKPFVKKFSNQVKKESGDLIKFFTEEGKKEKSSVRKMIGEVMNKSSLIKLAVGITLPAMMALSGGMYLIQSYFTKLQKKAGKVGIMKAMQELEDPRYFVDQYSTNKQSNSSPQSKQVQQSSSYLQSLMKIKNNAV